MNWVRAKLELERLPSGQKLELILDPGEALDSVPRSARDEGHQVEVNGRRVTIVKS